MEYIIIVAGGKGLRMGGEVPKQFLPVGGLPVLMRTMLRFREYSPDLQIILVLPSGTQLHGDKVFFCDRSDGQCRWKRRIWHWLYSKGCPLATAKNLQEP